MTVVADRRQRLDWLIKLAQYYHGWTRPQVANALGVSDLRRIAPQSGDIRIGIAVRLARLLDWNIDDVANYIWDDPIVTTGLKNKKNGQSKSKSKSKSNNNKEKKTRNVDAAIDDDDIVNMNFDEVNEKAWNAYQQGDYPLVIRLAKQAYVIAQTPEQRASSCNRELGGWDGLGRYPEVLETVRRGLAESPISSNRRLRLQSNLANVHYTLWNLTEARAVASGILDFYTEFPPVDRIAIKNQAFTLYVRGQTYRRLLGVEPENAQRHAENAAKDISRSQKIYEQLAEDVNDERYAGILRLCEGGLMEVDVSLGKAEALPVIDRIIEELTIVTCPEEWPVGELLESYGWSCIFGCNLALRHLSDQDQQRPMAILTNKAYEISDRLNNWSLRERALVMEGFRRQRLAEWAGLCQDWTLDQQEIRIITGTMARFPKFRNTGWQILNSAKLITEM